MTTKTALTTQQAIEAIRSGHTVTVPYHVEGYGPGRTCHSWGDPVLGDAAGPEGYLRLGVEGGKLIIDEYEDWCPPGMQGAEIDGSGHHIQGD